MMKTFLLPAALLSLAGLAGATTIVLDNYTTPAGPTVESPQGTASCGAGASSTNDVGATEIFGGTGNRFREVMRTGGSGCTQGTLNDNRLGLANNSLSTIGWYRSTTTPTGGGSLDLETPFAGGPTFLMFDFESDLAGTITITLNGVGGPFTHVEAAPGAPGTLFSRMINVSAWDLSAISSMVVTLSSNPGVGALDLSIDNIKLTNVPEPGTLAFMGLALIGLASIRRRQ